MPSSSSWPKGPSCAPSRWQEPQDEHKNRTACRPPRRSCQGYRRGALYRRYCRRRRPARSVCVFRDR
jgi:hypothetical protein